MSGRADLTDGEIKQQLNDVKAGKINWFLIGHVPKSDVKFKVTGKGNGGIDELKGELNDGKVQFGFACVDLSGVRKFIFISWCGEGVTGMKKGYFNGQSQDLSALFNGYHVQINARNEDDINNNDVLSRVKKATGASFYQQHNAQDTENAPESSSIKYEAPRQDQSTENRPTQSSIKYEAPRQDQSTESRPTQSSIKYEAPRQDQSTENRPAPSQLKYEAPKQDQSTENRPAPSRAPPKSAPPATSTPPKPAPPVTSAPPKPAPPPQQEVQQEEQAQEEQAQEESYNEEYAEEEYAEETATTEGTACRAVYDYQGEKEGDLSFNEGDMINVLDKSDPSGWWEGELNGVRGYFPSNFVEDA